jgi:UPF0176 protein
MGQESSKMLNSKCLSTMKIVVSSFYHYVPLPDCQELCIRLLGLAERLELKGLILLAEEGINATISGSREGIDQLYAWFQKDSRFDAMVAKESHCEKYPFKRLSIKIKPEIVKSGMEIEGHCHLEGSHLNAEQWEEILRDPETLVLDTRNDFEVRMGTFKEAINPGINNFSELTQWTQENLDPKTTPRVALFCTGGIRCEKASVWFNQQGFEEVYQLKGGILNYFDKAKNPAEHWKGDCFVFDHRVGVDTKMQPTYRPMCCLCQEVLTEQLEQCPHCGQELSHHWEKHSALRPGFTG